MAWLTALRAFLRHTAPYISVGPGDEADLLEVDKRLPPDGGYRLEVVERYLRERVPEFTRLFASDEHVGLFLVGAVAGCMKAKDVDPLAPWKRQGRPRNSGTFGSDEESRRHLLALMRQVISKGSRPTRETIAALLDVDVTTLCRVCKRFHSSWADLVREDYQRQ
jgi:hypothetical protein